MSYVNKIYGTTNCMIFTDTIQHYKCMAQQSVPYLQIQYNTTNVWHNKVYHIYRYNTTLQTYGTTNCTIFTDTVRTRQLLTAN
jgi:hypothetical protein